MPSTCRVDVDRPLQATGCGDANYVLLLENGSWVLRPIVTAPPLPPPPPSPPALRDVVEAPSRTERDSAHVAADTVARVAGDNDDDDDDDDDALFTRVMGTT